MARREREWDVSIPAKVLDAVRGRRMAPDGQERPVSACMRAGVPVSLYPWAQCEPGDFFYAPLRGTKGALQTSLRQGAARYDFEIVMVPWEIDGVFHYRVTVVLQGIAKIKRHAHRKGKTNVKPFDLEKRKKYHLRRYHQRMGHEEYDAPEAITIVPSEPEETLVGNEPVEEFQYDRAAMLEEARKRALLEAADIDPDEDVDYMGVSGDPRRETIRD